jgi:Fic family protein
MAQYIHNLPDWPRFRWDRERLARKLSAVRHEQGRLMGRMESLGSPLRQQAVLDTLTADVLKSSEIEGETLDLEMVRSSIARRLGMEIGGLQAVDRDVEGVVETMLDATGNYSQPLTQERLFGWHSSLFSSRRAAMRRIETGRWRTDRDGPMQVVSGPIGHERVHFEAPAAARLDAEMQVFLGWFNASGNEDWGLKAALGHLWFVTIHPFDDGNGRIARAIADMALARSENSSQRFYSMSAQIRRERPAYYGGLEQTQKGTMDVTESLDWFLDCLGRAIEGAQTALSGVLARSRFWESMATVNLNQRQRLVLHRLLDNFEGKLTTSKWAKLAKCSQDTAMRDILALVERGVLVRGPEGGRSTSYSLVLLPQPPIDL